MSGFRAFYRRAHLPMSGRFARLAVWVVVCAATATPVRAQLIQGSDSSRPFQSVFGGATGEQTGTEGLYLSGSLFAGYDDDIFARGEAPRLNRPRVSGEFVGSQASALFFKQFSTATIQANGATAARYVTDSRELVPTFHAANVAFTKQLGSRNTLRLQQTLLYRPFFSPAPFAGQSGVDPTLPGSDASLGDDLGGFAGGPDDTTIASDRTAFLHMSSAFFTRRLSPRSRIEFHGMFGVAQFGQTEQTANVDNWRGLARGRYVYDLTSFLAARVGYGHRRFAPRAGRRSELHDIDVGLLLNRPFQFRRGRTEFTATTGTTLLVRDRLDVEGGTRDGLLFRAIGTAQLRHTFRRDWIADTTYTRSVGFLDGFGEPIEGDRVTAGLSGLLTRALELQLQAGYMSGAIGMRDRNFDTALAGARLRLALNSKLALFAQYFYFQYTYDDDVAAALLLAPELERQGFRTGLTVWLPVVR